VQCIPRGVDTLAVADLLHMPLARHGGFRNWAGWASVCVGGVARVTSSVGGGGGTRRVSWGVGGRWEAVGSRAQSTVGGGGGPAD